ncbi:MAG TPA: 50S ribosomal protein L3 N(5)-glutamine methyltransferase [Porticoccus sp.]|nr:50S ribosomal protein L3 N(5)-glutamine methyltransferase [Porticoccus sp.]
MSAMLNTPESSVTIGSYIQKGSDLFDQAGLFFGHGTDNAWDESLALVLFALSLPWDSDSSILERPISSEEAAVITRLFDRRINERLPVAYLTGETWFAGFKFSIDQRVLVPRSPIAELIEAQFQPWLITPPMSILDLCTGSGCIGIACAHYFPEANVTLSDISTDALAVANKNVSLHQLNHRVSAVHSDLFAGLGSQRFDLIVSNPPYVDANDLASMPNEYHHEPEIGLSSGDDGLDFTRQLLLEATEHLNEQGTLIVEVGNSWSALEDMFPQVPFMWLEFERGGHGVFLITAEQLSAHREEFISS